MRLRQEVERDRAFGPGEHGERAGLGDARETGRQRNAVLRLRPAALQGQQRAAAPGIAVERRVGRGGEAGRQVFVDKPLGDLGRHVLRGHRTGDRAAGCARLGGETFERVVGRAGRPGTPRPGGKPFRRFAPGAAGGGPDPGQDGVAAAHGRRPRCRAAKPVQSPSGESISVSSRPGKRSVSPPRSQSRCQPSGSESA